MTLADASYPDDLLYHDQHDWAQLDGDDHAVFGITWYAQDSLGEVVFYDPPEVGATVAKDSSYAEVESVKAVSDVIAPMSGEIVAVNDALEDTPELPCTFAAIYSIGRSIDGTMSPIPAKWMMQSTPSKSEWPG